MQQCIIELTSKSQPWVLYYIHRPNRKCGRLPAHSSPTKTQTGVSYADRGVGKPVKLFYGTRAAEDNNNVEEER